MRICIVGAGAVGGLVGAKLAASGADVCALAHTAPLGINRHRFWHALHAFLMMPEPRSAPV